MTETSTRLKVNTTYNSLLNALPNAVRQNAVLMTDIVKAYKYTNGTGYIEIELVANRVSFEADNRPPKVYAICVQATLEFRIANGKVTGHTPPTTASYTYEELNDSSFEWQIIPELRSSDKTAQTEFSIGGIGAKGKNGDSQTIKVPMSEPLIAPIRIEDTIKWEVRSTIPAKRLVPLPGNQNFYVNYELPEDPLVGHIKALPIIEYTDWRYVRLSPLVRRVLSFFRWKNGLTIEHLDGISVEFNLVPE